LKQQRAQILLGTLIKLRTDRDPASLNFLAMSLWSKSTRSTRADLRASLGVSATSRTVVDNLRTAADQRYDDLLEWCIRTATTLRETATKPT
jgi:hypothetical protein